MNMIQQIEQSRVAELAAKRTMPDFQPGDTVSVQCAR